ncbi:plastocyanin/azurin family copper-binding protein [Conexibacter sp. SYSU D00693]|uniref:plastocyanin/azurin family copper-binding protein n=1 Tax=Conexibacter sp. SYSU D00693 TaxID=2812560 RepID=UPI00196B7772|nr:plastocyanin/azurin family copper-binding protein [Conexibacter sp. SYSU D00693]
MRRTSATTHRAALGLALGVLAPVALSACGNGKTDPDLVAGKQLFVQKCGACHQLDRADTKGVSGPDLDEAFRQALADGMGRNSIEGMVAEQIRHPARLGEGQRGKGEVVMPADLVEGESVTDVAAYVGQVVAKGGEDTGLLAEAVKKAGAGKPVAAKDGKLVIPADPTGQLAYQAASATAPAGPIEVESPNESGTPHDIVIDGVGKGEVVQNGGISKFNGTLDAGKTYTFYCSVPGHRQAGMEGKVTVK